MNFQLFDNILERQRCHHWTPLPTEQLRLRHLYQIIAYNLMNKSSEGVYYTLHSTAMCAPFYTSETVYSYNPRWTELEVHNLSNISNTAFVIRIWQKLEKDDKILLTWGINLSGLAYLGNKLSDIQPEAFYDNTVILYLRGGYFTYFKQVSNDLDKINFKKFLNVISTIENTYVYKIAYLNNIPENEIKSSYSIEKLRKLHSLQISIKNKILDIQALKDNIKKKIGVDENSCNNVGNSSSENTNQAISSVRYAPQLLTMESLNRMLETKPTRLQKSEIIRMQKEIESTKLKTKILLQERDRKTGQIRQLKHKYNNICDDNEERNSGIMENYHRLSKDIERLREWKREQIQQKEVINHMASQLQHRRRQLMSELLCLYPIERISNNKYTIGGLYLPSSDMLSDCSDGGLSVALGYVTHMLLMCASILQVPLRYPMHHFGSRSVIEDHITASLADRSREFPLYTRGKDRMQFNYAVYLLNKNIAQYLFLLGARTPDLKATLPNMLALLHGKEQRHEPTLQFKKHMDVLSTTTDAQSVCSQDTIKFDMENLVENKRRFGSNGNITDPILDSLRQECNAERSQSPSRFKRRAHKNSEPGPGLSQILAIPEAFLNKQMSSSSFKSYMNTNVHILDTDVQDSQQNVSVGDIEILQENSKSKNPDKLCDKLNNSHLTNIEQGTEMVAPETTPTSSKCISVNNGISTSKLDELTLKKSKRLSRSVGSYTDEHLELRNNYELGSDPLLNISSDINNSLLKHYNVDLIENIDSTQNEFLQKWLDSGPALICSEENLYPEEILGTSAHCSSINISNTNIESNMNTPASDSPLTLRTDALLKTNSFNLVKPKFN